MAEGRAWQRRRRPSAKDAPKAGGELWFPTAAPACRRLDPGPQGHLHTLPKIRPGAPPPARERGHVSERTGGTGALGISSHIWPRTSTTAFN